MPTLLGIEIRYEKMKIIANILRAAIMLYTGMMLITPALAQDSYVWLYTKIIGQSFLSNAPIVSTNDYALVTFAVYTDYEPNLYHIEIFKDVETGGVSIGSCLDLIKQPCYLKDGDASSTHTYIARIIDTSGTIYKTSNKVTISWIAATPGILTGTVTDASGNGISGATITATDYSGDYTTAGSYKTGTTDYKGSYTINIRPGTWNVWASANGYQDSPTVNGVIITSGQTTKQDFSLISSESNPGTVSPAPNANTGLITGYVTDWYKKTAIPGATVKAYNSATSSFGITDTAGKYSINIAPGIYTVTASATDYQDQTAPYGVSVASGQPTYQNFALYPKLATLTGTITDSSYKAIIGATITLTNPTRTLTTWSDDEGYSIKVPPDTYTVTASANGYTSSNPISITLTPGQTVTYSFILASSSTWAWDGLHPKKWTGS